MESPTHQAHQISTQSVFSNLTQPVSEGSRPAVSQSTNGVDWMCETTQSEFTNLVRNRRTIRLLMRD